ncbi:hypothetical protein AURDEDRAFT_164563 [Auricularia subglabra TFB-10046 SS5]|nr:hypothetical protein AURDEDRAFT_164563 [Auricularia subglabra TFB-10046 SS5]
MSDFTRRLPHELLQKCFDYLDLKHLTCTSAVSRRWQHIAINHETYWKHITISSTSQSATDWFLLRLSRSGTRLISVEARLLTAEPPYIYLILQAITAHLCHTQILECWINSNYSSCLFYALEYPARNLTELTLRYQIGDPERPVIEPLPRTFWGHAPSLRKLAAENIFLDELPSGGFPSVTALEYGLHARYDLAHVEALFTIFTHIRELTLTGCPRVKDVELIHPSAWLGLQLLCFVLGMAIPHEFLTALPLAALPHVACSGADDSDLNILMTGLDGTLHLHVQPHRECPDVFFMHVLEPTTSRLRSFAESIPAEGEDAITYPVVADCSDIMQRIALLSLPAELWQTVLATVSALPKLIELRVVLPLASEPLSACSGHQFRLPKLVQLTLRGAHEPIRAEIGHVAAFMSSLGEAPFPLKLRLDGVVLVGKSQDFLNVVLNVEYGGLDTPTYVIDQSGILA